MEPCLPWYHAIAGAFALLHEKKNVIFPSVLDLLRRRRATTKMNEEEAPQDVDIGGILICNQIIIICNNMNAMKR